MEHTNDTYVMDLVEKVGEGLVTVLRGEIGPLDARSLGQTPRLKLAMQQGEVSRRARLQAAFSLTPPMRRLLLGSLGCCPVGGC